MGQLNQETLERIEALKKAPEKPKVEYIWECQFDKLLKNKQSEEYKIVQEANVSPVLSPRRAFFGGGCNCFKLYYDCKNNEKINYIDFAHCIPGLIK